MPKMTVTKWMQIANKTPDNPEGNKLYDYIDGRTHGKRWSQEVSIGIPPSHKHIWDKAVTDHEAERGEDNHE